MASASSNSSVIFTRRTKRAFSQHLRQNPNKRRVSQGENDIIIEWLTKPDKQPLSQKEFSRRNYVRKTFAWDKKSQTLKYKGKRDQTQPATAKKGKGRRSQILVAAAKKGRGKGRTVVTTDMIADVVEEVHTKSGHGGWDATWDRVSRTHYGILRSDVRDLVKQCQECAGNPSKRPKGFLEDG